MAQAHSEGACCVHYGLGRSFRLYRIRSCLECSPVVNECYGLVSTVRVVLASLRMRIPLALVVLLLTVEAFSQQAKPGPVFNAYVGVLVHGDDPTGAIHGVVTRDSKPAKGISVTAHWVCPEGCLFMASTVITNDAGEYRFEPVTFGKYSVFVGSAMDLVGPQKPTAPPLSYDKVELSPNHAGAEVRFEVNDREPHKKEE